MIIPTFDFRNNNHSNLIIILFVIAIIYNVFSNSETTTILSVILLMIGGSIYISMYSSSKLEKNEYDTDMISKPKKADIDTIIEQRMKQNDRTATPSTSYYIKSFPTKGLKYLRENEKMLPIAKNLVYLQVFDKGRYEDLLLLMDRLQKIYMYILVGRYECRQGLNTFMDIRDLLLKTLYSFYIVLPMKTKHMYGLDPHGELDKSINGLTALTRYMITVLENYARRECKTPYVDPTLPLATDPQSSVNFVP